MPGLPGPDIHRDRSLDLIADQHGHSRRKPLDLLFQLPGHSFQPFGEGLEIIGIGHPHNDLGVALRYDILVHPGRPLADDHQSQSELPAFGGDGAHYIGGSGISRSPLWNIVVRLLYHHHSRRYQPPLSGLKDIGQKAGDDHGLQLRQYAGHIYHRRSPRPEQLSDRRLGSGEQPQLQERLQLAHQVPFGFGVAAHHLLDYILQGVDIGLRSKGTDGLV